MAQRQLRQVSTGRIYNWSKALSMRNDMVPHPPITETIGLSRPAKDGTAVIEIEYERKNYHIAEQSVDDFNKLVVEHADLKVAVGKLESELSEKPKYFDKPLTKESIEGQDTETKTEPEKTEPVEEVSATDEVTGPARAEAILDAIGLLVDSGDKNHFAGNGMPKVQSIMEITEFDITAKERDDAWAEYQSKK